MRRERDTSPSSSAPRTPSASEAISLNAVAGGSRDDVTDLLRRWQQGSEEAQEHLFRAIYPGLRRLAASRLGPRGPGLTIEATEIVHEAYLRLVDQRRSEWQNRAHFFAIASRIIRRVIIDHLRAKQGLKRGGRAVWLPVDETHLVAPHRPVDLLDLDRALDKLESLDEEAARLVEMRYFGGLTIDEAATVLRLGRTSTVGKWRAARAWLRVTLGADACNA